MSNTFENTCNVCWGEKLHGMGFIPECEIEAISYHSEIRNQPAAVILKPWPTDRGGDPNKNWVIEFKTYKQAWGALMGASIGGFWFSETFPVLLFSETLIRCRDYFEFRGGRFCEFTPLDPWLSLEIEKMLEKAPDTWKVYHCNTLKNLPNLSGGGEKWLETMKAGTPEDLHATRIYGVFAAFQDQIFPGFSRDKHMVDEVDIRDRVLGDNTLIHAMGTDWGSGGEHPHVTLWGCYDKVNDVWFIYDEYRNASQSATPDDHIKAVLDRCEEWGWPVGIVEGKRKICREMRPGYGINHADSASKVMIHFFGLGGIPTAAYAKTPGSVEEGITHLNLLLMVNSHTGEPRLKISSRCKSLLDEMILYRRKRGQTNMLSLNPALSKDVPLDRWNHCIDSMRYMVRGTQRYEGWESPKFVQRDERIAGRNAERAVRVASGRPYPSGRARSLVRFEK